MQTNSSEMHTNNNFYPQSIYYEFKLHQKFRNCMQFLSMINKIIIKRKLDKMEQINNLLLTLEITLKSKGHPDLKGD